MEHVLRQIEFRRLKAERRERLAREAERGVDLLRLQREVFVSHGEMLGYLGVEGDILSVEPCEGVGG